MIFFFNQKTVYEVRISDWSSDVCSSDLLADAGDAGHRPYAVDAAHVQLKLVDDVHHRIMQARVAAEVLRFDDDAEHVGADVVGGRDLTIIVVVARVRSQRSEEHTSELQSLMRIVYAVFCMNKQQK